MGRKDNFGTSSGKYDDSFKSMVESVETRLEGQGKRIKITSKEDLKLLFERLDKQRRDKSGKPRITDNFIQKILNTRSADSFLGKTIGRFGGQASTLKRPVSEKETYQMQRAREQGVHIYTYPQGRAKKETFKNKRGKMLVRFRDLKTGHFVKSSIIQE